MAGVLLLAALGMVTVNLASLIGLRLYLTDVVDTNLTKARDTVQRYAESRSSPIPETTLNTLVPAGAYIALLDEHGRVVTETAAQGPDGQPTPCPDLPAPVLSGFSERPSTVSARGALIPRYRALGFPVGANTVVRPATGAAPKPVSTMVIASNLAPSDDVVYWLIGAEAVATLAALAGIAVLGRGVLRVGMRPLQDMATTATAIAAGDLHQRIEVGRPHSEIGEVGSALNHAFDARQRSEERLRQFVADVSHELRTPLTTIRGWAQLHLHGLAQEPELVERAMLRIEEEAARMHTTVEELLLLAQLDQGRPLADTPVDLGRLAADAAEDARALDPGRPIAVDVQDEVFASGDEDRLLQVLRNLLSNAQQHTPTGTPVAVAVRSLPDDQVELTVTDHGPGMDPETARRIFERFYRGDDSRSPSTGGTGLGLAIVKSITEAHGGTVTVTTAEGEGSTFTVTLPAAR
ncbi:two-component system, OmpR family, sensor kinase [Saccharopolyspora antimicrobica]|uniref:histidine kinase n=1 Tax=Saccharopolyspora antimicrobica TaxID=455193 RepID=A0A1I5GRC2_9PSEU|nr:HAMP domain-containing sensor histidine kinase [Saccharopolyspora antimicrobica]RKT87398.1 two-component system OmpR family sensor kinase [Saccharopolyspora antimicrobica]SFO38406.1 two-component system, OmpR family, sensor kinase [Saccharopolyspora antimicrobica]